MLLRLSAARVQSANVLVLAERGIRVSHVGSKERELVLPDPPAIPCTRTVPGIDAIREQAEEWTRISKIVLKSRFELETFRACGENDDHMHHKSTCVFPILYII